MRFDLIAFDADDTLWHELEKYIAVEDRFTEMLMRHVSEEVVRTQLHKTDIENLRYFGYGVKGFVLSMIETAIQLTEGKVTGTEIEQIIQWGRDMLDHPIECFPHVETTLVNLAQKYNVMVLTKGDLFDQETKIARSGLAKYFDYVEIVSEKSAESYTQILTKYNAPPDRFLMIGNALRSDILPVLEIGGHALHIPAGATWAHEQAKIPPDLNYQHLDHIGQVPGWLAAIESHTLAQ